MTEFRTLLSNFVKKSQTNGLLKNDGTVDTTSYISTSNTQGLLKNDGTVDTTSYISTSNTQGLLKNDGTVDTTSYLSTHQDITGKEDKSNKVTSISSSSTDTQYPSAKAVYDLISLIYPIGSIYMSVNSTDPSTFLGGTWEQIKDRFLLGSGDTYTNGATGGSSTVTLTANQSGVKSHAHTISHTHGVGSGRQFATRSDHSDGVGERGAASGTAFYAPSINKSDNWYGAAATSTQSTTDSGNATAANASEAHENMPPYVVVYMWKRIG